MLLDSALPCKAGLGLLTGRTKVPYPYCCVPVASTHTRQNVDLRAPGPPPGTGTANKPVRPSHDLCSASGCLRPTVLPRPASSRPTGVDADNHQAAREWLLICRKQTAHESPLRPEVWQPINATLSDKPGGIWLRQHHLKRQVSDSRSQLMNRRWNFASAHATR